MFSSVGRLLSSKQNNMGTGAMIEETPKKTHWLAGFITVSLMLLIMVYYTFQLKDLTLYQLTIAAMSYYTMVTMGLCLVFPGKKRKLNDGYRPFISVIVPAKNEELVIENTVRSLFRLVYEKEGLPNYEVIIVDDNSSDSTFTVLSRLKNEFPGLVPLKRTGGAQGKSAVLNFALKSAKGEIIAVFDADSKIAPDFLEKSVSHFLDESIAGVQGRVRMINAGENILTKMQEDEFAVFAHMFQISKPIYNGIMQLAGNGQLTRKKDLLQVGGWNEISATDDLDLTMKFLLSGKRVQYAPDAVVWQEAVTSLNPFMKQRIRWAEGMLRCIFDYFYAILGARLGIGEKIDTLAGLLRILATMVVWIGYIQWLTVVIFPDITFVTSSPLSILSNVPIFVIVMGGGVLKYLGERPFLTYLADLMRIPFYWIYNIFWMLAVPVGFVNCIRNRNTISWDKTIHRGKNALEPQGRKRKDHALAS